MAAYILFDHISFLIAIGVLKGWDSNKFKKWSSNGWFWGLVFTIVADIIVYWNLVQQEREVRNNPEELTKIRETKTRMNFGFIKNVADLNIAGYSTHAPWLSEGWIGICGCTNAVVALYEQWPKK